MKTSRTPNHALIHLLCLGALLAAACGGQAATDPSPTAGTARTGVATPASNATPPTDGAAPAETSKPAAADPTERAVTPTQATPGTEAQKPPAEPSGQDAEPAPGPSVPEAKPQPKPANPPAAGGRTMYVATEGYTGLNLRSEPSTESEIILSVPYARAVQVTGEAVINDRGEEWYPVAYGRRRGFMTAPMLSAKAPAPKPVARSSAPEPRPTAERPAPAGRAVASGAVRDAETGKPVRGAWVYLNEEITRTDDAGRYGFVRGKASGALTVMAPGYAKLETSTGAVKNGVVRLQPFDAKALYVPLAIVLYAPERLAEVYRLIERSPQLNAIVVDIKTDRGFVWDTRVPLARRIGAQIDQLNLRKFTADAHRRGVYVIGRLTAFKDTQLAKKVPSLAIKDPEGKVWLDEDDFAYADPFDRTAWKYLADLAVEAAQSGVDEIQWDYIRFPVDGDLSTARYKGESTAANRIEQITGFLEYAEERIRPAKAFIAADIFGRTAWHDNEGGLGQRLENMAQHLDYVSPMLYPSGFDSGSGGYDVPPAEPYGIIEQSMERANPRMRGLTARLRPWLQAFDDYSSAKVEYDAREHIAQRRAADELGASGWMFWHPLAKYDLPSYR